MPTQEKRAAERRDVLKAAAVWFADRAFQSGCIVSDLSATGCRLRSDEAHILPASFELSFGGDTIIERCEVVWREADEIGVRFARKG